MMAVESSYHFDRMWLSCVIKKTELYLNGSTVATCKYNLVTVKQQLYVSYYVVWYVVICCHTETESLFCCYQRCGVCLAGPWWRARAHAWSRREPRPTCCGRCCVTVAGLMRTPSRTSFRYNQITGFFLKSWIKVFWKIKYELICIFKVLILQKDSTFMCHTLVIFLFILW